MIGKFNFSIKYFWYYKLFIFVSNIEFFYGF